MQMKKHNSGITLIALVITIIVLLILAGISFTMGSSNIESTKQDLLESELYIVQQSVIQQYSIAKTLGETGRIYHENKENIPSSYVGELIDELDIGSIGFSNMKLNFETYDDYYYRLEKKDFDSINVNRVEDIYVVNYSTGEVYNETAQIYLKGTLETPDTTTITNTEFSEDIW